MDYMHFCSILNFLTIFFLMEHPRHTNIVCFHLSRLPFLPEKRHYSNFYVYDILKCSTLEQNHTSALTFTIIFEAIKHSKLTPIVSANLAPICQNQCSERYLLRH